MYNIFGKLPESTAPAWQIDWNGLMKVVRFGLVAGGGALIAYLLKEIASLDILPNSTFDESILIPLLSAALEGLRRMTIDYQHG